ncbi:MAG: type I pullulanase [Francisella sp.]
MQITNQNIWIQDKSGKFNYLNAVHQVFLDFETNSIRFRIQAHGFIHGYIIAGFNNWQKSEDYKLKWSIDSDDGSLWLTKDLFNIENLNEGTNQYSFILVNLHGEEFKVSINDHDFIPLSFNWQVAKENLEIKASENYVVLGFNLELVAITKSVTGYQKIIDVEWQVSHQSPHINLVNGNLLIDTNSDITEIKVSCIAKDNHNLKAERIFKVIREDRNGSLVHFIKKDQQYKGEYFEWDLWTFSKNKPAQPVALPYRSDFGVYGICQKKNVIVRKKVWDRHWYNDWAEQTNSFKISKKNHNYYIIYGDADIYTSLTDVVRKTNPRIIHAIMNEASQIVAYLSDIPRIGTFFELWINSKKVENVEVIVKHRSKQIIFKNLPYINPYDLVEIRANNTFNAKQVLMGDYLNKFYYPDNIGVYFSDDFISLRIWAPTAIKVEVLIYNKDLNNNKKNPDFVYELKAEREYGTHHIEICRKQHENKYYLYRLYFESLDNQENRYTKVTYAVDPYACGVGLNGRKGFLVDLNSAEVSPEKWQQDHNPICINREDAIIYETHLRDFTISPESGVSECLRGKYLGAIENDTYYVDPHTQQKVSTGISSLVELGITHVHLLPFFDFSSVDEKKNNKKDNRNWGYDPQNYNAPDGSYSINPYDPLQRIKGVRNMILGFHQKDIGVIMDMVYNHMTTTTNFDNIVPKYYFRTDELGNFTNGSGCGNELASEKPMVSKFIQDSVLHWVKNYKIDGIRFDLMELIDIDTIKNIVNKVKQINPSIIIYGEPWKGGDSPLSNGTHRGTQRNQQFSIFNDYFRDAIRGNNSPSNGFVNGDPHNPNNMHNVIEGLRGSIYSLTAMPGESVNYVDAHDNYTLWDQIEKSQNYNITNGNYRQNIPENIFENIFVRQNALALGIILTAQGIPFIHGGSEFLRTKQGDHNSYNSGDEINAYHWSDKLRYKAFFDYIAGLIKIRKEHPAFRMKDRETIEKHLNITTAHHDNKSGVIISHFKNYANGDSWQDIVVIYNATSIDGYDVNALMPLPADRLWHIVANHEKAGTETIKVVKSGELPGLKSHSLMIIHS